MKIAALSDLHGNLPDLPKADVTLLGGDLLWDKYDGLWARDASHVQEANLRRDVLPWLARQGVKHAFGTWGNHDWIRRSLTFPELEIYIDDGVEIDGVKFWFTPWSPTFMNWNWMKADHEDGLGKVYAQIPTGLDVLVSHCPPYGYGDKVPGTHDDECPLRWHLGGNPDKCTCGCEAHVGSKELLRAIERVKPKVVICGHIHEGYGKYTLCIEDGDLGSSVIDIYNVSVVDEGYKLVNPVTVIEL